MLSGGLLLGNPRAGAVGHCAPQALAAPRGCALLPVPLYEAAGNALLCAGLLLYRKKKARRTPGSSTGLYLSAYAVLRFCWNFCAGTKRAAAGGR